MRIQKIRLNNFKSFYGEIVIDFTELAGLWKVAGRIGAGKTTIGESIIFGLYGTISGKSNKDLISWGEKHGRIELWLTCRGRSIYINREINTYGQSPLSVEVDGEPIIFTDKRDAQSQLESEYLDGTRSMMELLCVISFNNFKSLSTLNAKDTKSFLDNVFGLDRTIKYVEIAKSLQQEAYVDMTTADAEKGVYERQLERMAIPIIEGNMEELRADIRKIKDEIASKKNSHTSEIQPLQQQLLTLQYKQGEVTALGKLKKKEIDFIKKGICPICGASIDQSQLKVKESERQVLLDSYSSITDQISSINAHIREKIDELNKYIDEHNNRVKSQENLLIRLEEQAKRLAENQADIESIKTSIEELDERVIKYRSDMNEYQALMDLLGKQIKQTILSTFIPSINAKIREISGLANLQYIPEYDESFKCYITTGDMRKVPSSSLSTGQLKMVDMVIVLGILSSVMSRIDTNIIFIDELFSNLDPHTREDLINIFKTIISQDTSILVVSHQDIDNDLFEGKIHLKLKQEDGKNKSYITIEK